MKLSPRIAGLVVSLLLLGGCGGGGGSDAPPVVQPFLVITNVAGVPAVVPGMSIQMTLDSGDTLELEASPAGMQWIVITDGNVVEAGVSEDGAHWSATLNSPKGGQVVIRARSSADPSQEATFTVLVNAQRYARRDAAAGEALAWRDTTTRNDGGVSIASLQATTVQVAADGSHSVELRDITALPGALAETGSHDADGNLLARQFAGGRSCSYSPGRRLLDFPLHYGKSWSANWDFQCSSGERETAQAALTVDGFERITVPQGAHDALRITAHVLLSQSNDPQLSLGNLGQAAYSQDIACWWSVTLKRLVQCTTTTHYVGSEPPAYPKTVLQELLDTR